MEKVRFLSQLLAEKSKVDVTKPSYIAPITSTLYRAAEVMGQNRYVVKSPSGTVISEHLNRDDAERVAREAEKRFGNG